MRPRVRVDTNTYAYMVQRDKQDMREDSSKIKKRFVSGLERGETNKPRIYNTNSFELRVVVLLCMALDFVMLLASIY